MYLYVSGIPAEKLVLQIYDGGNYEGEGQLSSDIVVMGLRVLPASAIPTFAGYAAHD